MKRRIFSISISVLVTAALLAGCGGQKTVYDSLYADLSEDISSSDPSVLSGRHIVIDPGHGGEYDGAVGADSLSESEVNLGVALYLWGLLRDAGAEVHMTRSSDRDFLPEGAAEPESDLAALLRDDLAGRIDRANEFEPEVFISIHHNSNIALDRERNGVEVYYRGTDHGASLELATDVHTHLARNLGIEATTIKTGNYYVLRNSTAGAAVLGEASYLSNPGVEEKLKLSAKQKLEAEAYFLGLVEYFTRGVPVIEIAGPNMDVLPAPVRFEFFVQPGAGVAIDPASFEARIDGRLVECFQPVDGGNPFFVMPASTPNGPFEVSFSARSVGGATATFGPKELVLDRDARFFLPMPPSRPYDGGTLLTVLVLDAGGRPVADGKRVTLRAAGCKNGSTSRTRKGLADFISDGNSRMHIVSSGAFSDTLLFALEDPRTTLLALAIDSRTGVPVQRPVLRLADGNTIPGDNRGAIRSNAADTSGAVLYAAGYHPAHIEGIAEGGKVSVTSMDPVYDGALHGRRIVIDPAGGGTVDAGRGTGALRGATVNMRLAKELEMLLTAGGARVLVTRKGEEQLSDQQRIFRTNRARAHMAIGLRFGDGEEEEPGCFVHNYPGSVNGTAFADSLVQVLSGTPPCESFSRIESSDIFLQQTNCPAVVISGGTLADKDTETILGSSRWIRIEAEAILRSLVIYFDDGD